MDRNQFIGLFLIAGLFIGYMIYTQPSQEEIEKARLKRDSIEQLQNAAAQLQDSLIAADTNTVAVEIPENIPQDSLNSLLADKYGVFGGAAVGEEKFYTLENDLMQVVISSKGGRIYSVKLNEYKTHDSLDLVMFDGIKDKFEYRFFSQNRSINTGELYFFPQFDGDMVSATTGKKSAIFRLSAGEGRYIEYNYTLEPGKYDLKYDVKFVGLDDVISKNMGAIDLHWSMHSPAHEKGHKTEGERTGLYYKFHEDEVDYLTETKDDSESLATRVKWVAFKQQFFSAVLIADTFFVSGKVEHKLIADSKYLKHFTADMVAPFEGENNAQKIGYKWYFGPNKFSILKEYDIEMERLIPFGASIIGWVNRYAIIPLFNFLSSYIGNIGLLILVLTIIIKVVIFPLTYKSYLSTAKMRVLKPEIDAINAKIPKEKALERQQATMALYKKAGVNPAGGCIPMLLQFPILIAMFQFFPASIELRQKAFLWATDLSTYDSIYNLPFNIPYYGDHVSLFTLLMAASIVLTTLVNSAQMDSNSAIPGMKFMMYSMPVFMVFWFNSYSSGLSYYYFVANIITYAQTIAIRRMVNDEEVLKKIHENKKKPVVKSKFQERLEQMAKQQKKK